jgi:hypothetical protein
MASVYTIEVCDLIVIYLHTLHTIPNKLASKLACVALWHGKCGEVTSRVSKPYSRARMRGAVEVKFLNTSHVQYICTALSTFDTKNSHKTQHTCARVPKSTKRVYGRVVSEWSVEPSGRGIAIDVRLMLRLQLHDLPAFTLPKLFAQAIITHCLF